MLLNWRKPKSEIGWIFFQTKAEGLKQRSQLFQLKCLLLYTCIVVTVSRPEMTTKEERLHARIRHTVLCEIFHLLNHTQNVISGRNTQKSGLRKPELTMQYTK